MLGDFLVQGGPHDLEHSLLEAPPDLSEGPIRSDDQSLMWSISGGISWQLALLETAWEAD